MPDNGRLSRRTFIQSAGVTTAFVAAGAPAWPALPATAEPAAGPVELIGEWTCDLTRRWLRVDPTVRPPDLVAAWTCDEGAGYAFADLTGSGHRMWITGSEWNTTDSGLVSSFRRRGLRGGGIHLDGTRWLESRPTSAFNVGPRMSVTSWVRLAGEPGRAAVMLGRAGSFRVSVTRDRAVRFVVRDANGNEYALTSDAGIAPARQWFHVAATVDAERGRLAVYINARKRANASIAPFTIASAGVGVRAGRWLVGDLDELSVHRVALSAAAVRRLFLVGLPKLYTQARVTIDSARTEWTRFTGNEPVPHPVDDDAQFVARFDNSAVSEQGHRPTAGRPVFLHGWFGAALDSGSGAVQYSSPSTGPNGTFEAWYLPMATDEPRQGELFRATGRSGAWLSLDHDRDRWRVRLGTGGTVSHVLTGPAQTLLTHELEHIAVSWGEHGGGRAVTLLLGGVEVARAAIGNATTTFDGLVAIGGVTRCLIDDVRISRVVRAWGDTCPHGQTSTDSAALDLRDALTRPTGTAPVRWRPGADGGAWLHQARTWEDVTDTAEDPRRRQALVAPSTGVQTLYHPDAYGHASSAEVGVAFATAADGWAGVFVQASGPAEAFSGYSFMINPGRTEMRIARHTNDNIITEKVLSYDFTFRAQETYTLTLTSAGDGVLRGFVDSHNVISMPAGGAPPTRGYAGLVTHDITGWFDNVHFTPMTPPTGESRRVQVRSVTTGPTPRNLAVIPFRWHKRRGLLPWQYTSKNPELPGNIAGAYTDTPDRPIPPARWRSNDSANSDITQIDGKIVYFMRGGGDRGVENWPPNGRIGVLHTTGKGFDGVHFDDPNLSVPDFDSGSFLKGNPNPLYDEIPDLLPRMNVNSPSSAYIGGHRLLHMVQEIRGAIPEVNDGDGQQEPGEHPRYPRYHRLTYGMYDLTADDWAFGEVRGVDWSSMDPESPENTFRGLDGTVELDALRDPDTDEYRVVMFHLVVGDDNVRRMGTVGLAVDSDGVPQLDPEMPQIASLSRTGEDCVDGVCTPRNLKAIYNFRVLFDNGIYYLHYSDGPDVPDWPTHFVLAATTDLYRGPWVVNPQSDVDAGVYFRRGSEFEPDNGAIWHGAMFKHRGRYYHYYENMHAIEDVDVPYQHYADPHVGSRVGYATAMS